MMNGKNAKEAIIMQGSDLEIVRVAGRWSNSIRSYKHKVMLWCAVAVKSPTNLTNLGLSIVLADDEFVRNLNKQYRNQDKPTNVLSFQGSNGELGDVILAYETIVNEANEQNKDFSSHLAHLIVHGILHLQGFDHENDEMAEKMEAQEIAILEKLGFSNPYNIN
jgi:probable rRNA maturation factor